MAGRALSHKARQDGRVVSVTVLIAVRVKKTGEREVVLSMEVGPSKDGTFWLSFFARLLVARGLSGVRLVVSDAHRGLEGAIEAVLLQGAGWRGMSFYLSRSPRFKASWTTRTSAFVLHAHAYHVLGVLVAVFIISYLSYRYIESPFLWRKPT